MRRLVSFIVLFISILSLFTACEKTEVFDYRTEEKRAEKVAEDFLRLYFTISDQDFNYYKAVTGKTGINELERDRIYALECDKFRHYISSELYREFVNNRIPTKRVGNAYIGNYYLEAGNIKLQKSSEGNSKSRLSYSYFIDIIKKEIEGGKEYKLNLRSSITLDKDKGNWKITWFGSPKM